MNQKEEELYELPKWVKLVNRILRGEKRLEDERPNINQDSKSKVN